MINTTLKLYVSGDTPTVLDPNKVWIKLTKDNPVDTSKITKKQLAEWLNEAYGITNHCTGERASDAFDRASPEDTTQSRLHSAMTGGNCYESADILAMRRQCNPLIRLGESKKFDVYVHCSSEQVRDRYSLRCSTDISPTGPTRTSSTISVIIDFNVAKEVPIYRFADPGEVSKLWADSPPRWLGSVIVDNKLYDSRQIGIAWSNGRVVLSRAVSGRLLLSLPIQYDAWRVSVPGVMVGDQRDYSASAYAFYETINPPASLDLNDEQNDPAEGSDCDLCGGVDTPTDSDTEVSGEPIGGPCQKKINWELRNRCTDKIIDSGVRYEDAPCPNTTTKEVSYTSAQTPEGAAYTAGEFEEECCGPPSRDDCLPCKKNYSVYGGGAAVQPSEEALRDRYAPSQVFFNRVGVEGGGPCGQREDEFTPPDNGGCGCPKNSYFDFHVVENYVDIYRDGQLYWESGLKEGCSGGDLQFVIPRGSKSAWTVKAFNYPKDGSDQSIGRKIEFDFVVDGELIESVSEGECIVGGGDLYDGGEFYSGDFECGY